MSEKHIKIMIGQEPPHVDDCIPIVDVETKGRLFYEEVGSKERAEHLVKCWNLCEGRTTDELDDCVVVTKYE